MRTLAPLLALALLGCSPSPGEPGLDTLLAPAPVESDLGLDAAAYSFTGSGYSGLGGSTRLEVHEGAPCRPCETCRSWPCAKLYGVALKFEGDTNVGICDVGPVGTSAFSALLVGRAFLPVPTAELGARPCEHRVLVVCATDGCDYSTCSLRRCGLCGEPCPR